MSALSSAGAAPAQLIVLSKDSALPPSGSCADPALAHFVAAAKVALAAPEFDDTFSLENPPSWGRVVSPETTGTLQIRRRFPQGLLCRLSLRRLLPAHRYILCINGNPQRLGNDRLPLPVPGNPKEKYYDFLIVPTDASGGYDADLAVLLPRGPYDVRFYVKDTADFKIVLYKDFFPFSAE